MALSSATVEAPTRSIRLTGRRVGGAPVYTYRRLPGVPPVTVLRYPGADLPAGGVPPGHTHAHDFLVLCYFESGGHGALRVNGREWTVRPGDAFVIAPGEVIAAGTRGLAEPAFWTAFFPPDVFGPPTTGTFLSWRSHPLLFPFVRGAAGGMHRVRVPPADRPAWSDRFRALERELAERRDGYNEAALAELTLLLVDLSRLATDVPADFTRRDEPLLAAVFDVIEARHAQPISLDDVAAAVGLTPGHLTTVVGRKTGRTVQQWITERRMAEARRLLAGTELTVRAVGTRVGYRDPSYFIRSFRRRHGVTPIGWRRAGRG
jgi:AraC-like DNA-binding protein